MNTCVVVYTDSYLTLLGLCVWMCSSEAEQKLLLVSFLNSQGIHICAMNPKSLDNMELPIFSTPTCNRQLIYPFTAKAVKLVYQIVGHMLSKHRILCDFSPIPHSEKIKSRLMRSYCCFYVSVTVYPASFKKNERGPIRSTLLPVHISSHNFFVFYSVCVVSRESMTLLLP
jgi:hypothetical protein